MVRTFESMRNNLAVAGGGNDQNYSETNILNMAELETEVRLLRD